MLLILTAALLTIGPEFVYLKDQFGQRLNTIFKFYYQAWVLFGLAAAVGLYVLSQRARIVGGDCGNGLRAAHGRCARVPVYMIQWAGAWYGQEPTLNGLAFVEINRPFEHDAIQWLDDNTTGTPVVLEAVGGQYSDTHVSRHKPPTTVLGWPGHERQWARCRQPGTRSARTGRALHLRIDRLGYNSPVSRRIRHRLHLCRSSEREAYGENGLDKIHNNMEIAYQNDTVTIYAWD